MADTERTEVEGLLDLMDASSSAWQLYGEGLGSHAEALEADARLEGAIRALRSERDEANDTKAMYYGQLLQARERANRAEAALSRKNAALLIADAVIEEAEAIMGGEYDAFYGPFAEKVLDYQAARALASGPGHEGWKEQEAERGEANRRLSQEHFGPEAEEEG